MAKNMSQSKPFKERRAQYYCGLCGRYNITMRLNHLKTDHNSNTTRHSQRYKPIIEVIFAEVHT